MMEEFEAMDICVMASVCSALRNVALEIGYVDSLDLLGRVNTSVIYYCLLVVMLAQ